MPSRETQRAWVGTRAARIPKNMVGTTRWNAAFAYLDPVRARPNLRIQAETLVDRIVLEGTRPTAIIAHTAEGEQRVRVNLVVLAAGAYMSPAILQRSGIGPEEELAGLGVPVSRAPPRSRPESSGSPLGLCDLRTDVEA